jgi:hypothetical protein
VHQSTCPPETLDARSIMSNGRGSESVIIVMKNDPRKLWILGEYSAVEMECEPKPDNMDTWLC